jgi:hypothetical protein
MIFPTAVKTTPWLTTWAMVMLLAIAYHLRRRDSSQPLAADKTALRTKRCRKSAWIIIKSMSESLHALKSSVC